MANTEKLGLNYRGLAWGDGERIPRASLPDGTLGEAVVALGYTGQGKGLLFAAISQGSAGTTQLVAAGASTKVKVVSYLIVLDVAGSFKFTDGAVDLTGAVPVAANGGAAIAGQPSAHLFETAAVNRPLNIVTVTGKAFGHFSYFIEA